MSAPTIRLLGGWSQVLQEHSASCRRAHPVLDMTGEELERIKQLLATVSYRDWTAMVSLDEKGLVRLQVSAMVASTLTGEVIENRTRPLPLCPEMSDGMITDLVFELTKELELHEAAERFTFGGNRVYFPHQPDGRPLPEVPALRGASPAPSASPVQANAISEERPK
jgi:hypothetical protein